MSSEQEIDSGLESLSLLPHFHGVAVIVRYSLDSPRICALDSAALQAGELA
jgi:hypothetical protein